MFAIIALQNQKREPNHEFIPVVTYDSESTASFQSSTYNWSAILVSGSNREKGILFVARQFTTLEGAKNYVGQIKEPNMVECLKTVLVGADCREIDLDGLIEVLEVEGKYSVLVEENVITKVWVVGKPPLYGNLSFSETLQYIGWL